MKFDLGKWAFSNDRLITLMVVAMILGGMYAYYDMPKLEDPEIPVRQALVVGIYPGASAHQVELEVADPLEKSIQEISDVDYIESLNYADMCIITVALNSTVSPADIQQAWDMMRRKVAKTALPAGVTTQVKDDFGDVYGMFYALTGEGLTNRQLSDYAELIRRELKSIDGVGRIELFGEVEECIHVKMHQDRLANMGVLPAEVIMTLNGQNATVYSGYYQNGDNRIRISVDDRYRTVEDIANLIIQGHERDQIRLKDIGDIEMQEATPIRAAMQRNGQKAIGISVVAASGTDIIKIGKAVQKRLDHLQQNRLPIGVEINKIFYQPERVSNAMNSFMLNLLESVLLVLIVLVFCMGLRSGVIIGISLVVIVAGSIMMLSHMGGTLQRVSLASFILAMGMLVDNAIVIVDGILVDYAHGKPRMEALTSIGKKTAMPLLGATLIAILSFLPIFMSPDATGLYVRDLFIVMTVSLLLSWVLALTHVPIMASRWLLKKKEDSEATSNQQQEVSYTGKSYDLLRKILVLMLNHRWKMVAAQVIMLLIAVFCAAFLPRAFFPDMDYEQLYMEYKLPEGRNYTQVQHDLDSIRHWLEKREEVTNVVTSIGATPSRYNLVRTVHYPSLAYGELIVDFKSPKVLKKNIDELQREVSQMFPDAYVKFKRYNLMFMAYPIQIFLSGPDPEVLEDLRDSCKTIIQRTGAMCLITDNWEPRVPMYNINYDQSVARHAGFTRTEVGMSLMAATEGLPVGKFYDGNHQIGIYVDCVDDNGNLLQQIDDATVFGITPNLRSLADDSKKEDILSNGLDKTSNVQSLLLHNSPLKQVASGVNVEWEYPVVFRRNGLRTHTVQGSPTQGYDTESAQKAVARALDEQLSLPEGYKLEWGGEKLASDMSMKHLFKFYPLAILLMFAILIMLFKSFRTGFMLFVCIPMIFIGVIPAILVSGKTFGFVAIVGVLGLVGMMLKNGIVLVDEINLQLSNGKSMNDALVESSLSRLRPVSMASLTTILGMLPLLSDAMFGSMAATIMGGLFAGTIIVLILIPVLYSLLYDNRKQ